MTSLLLDPTKEGRSRRGGVQEEGPYSWTQPKRADLGEVGYRRKVTSLLLDPTKEGKSRRGGVQEEGDLLTPGPNQRGQI